MKMQMLSVVAVAALVAGCSKTNVEQASQQFNQLPAAVQKTVHSTMPNAEVAGVDEERLDGRLVYQIKFRDSDRNPSIWVAPDGTLVKTDTGAIGGARDSSSTIKGSGSQSEFSALPVPVQKAIEKNTPRAEITGIRRHDESGRVYYEIEYAGKSENPTIQVSEDGTVLKPLSKENK